MQQWKAHGVVCSIFTIIPYHLNCTDFPFFIKFPEEVAFPQTFFGRFVRHGFISPPRTALFSRRPWGRNECVTNEPAKERVCEEATEEERLVGAKYRETTNHFRLCCFVNLNIWNYDPVFCRPLNAYPVFTVYPDFSHLNLTPFFLINKEFSPFYTYERHSDLFLSQNVPSKFCCLQI